MLHGVHFAIPEREAVYRDLCIIQRLRPCVLASYPTSRHVTPAIRSGESALQHHPVHGRASTNRPRADPRPTTYHAPGNKTTLYGEQEVNCAGCKTHFEAWHLTIDHILARSKGGTDHLGNLQLLCANCNAIKGNRGMEYLVARLARD